MSDFEENFSEDENSNQVLVQKTPADVRLSAMNLLARREHSRLELQQKLRKRFDDALLIEATLDRLADQNLQSDERFAESFVQQRVGSGSGPVRIQQELRARGLSDLAVDQAIEAVAADWSGLAENVYYKKYGTEPAVDINDKAKRARFMQYRGFFSEHYQHLL